jgi:ADP-heptose:LPS heptosyltransferase
LPNFPAPPLDRSLPEPALSPLRGTAGKLRRRARWALLRALVPLAPRGNAPLPALRKLRRILLVSVNYRLGNTVLSTVPLSAVVEALPNAELDFLGGPAAPAVVEGHPLRRVHVVGRFDLIRPLRLWRLLRRLRGEHYDAAVHLSLATESVGAFLTGLSGAEHRIGCLRRGNLFFTSAIEPPRPHYRIDRFLAYLRCMGIDAPGERRIVIAQHESSWAEKILIEQLGPEHPSVVGIFLSGRGRTGRGWKLRNFGAVARGLRERGLQPIVFLGPEEKRYAARIKRRIGEAFYVELPDLRGVTALVGRCAAVLSADSGPMHLSLATGTPTVAVFRFADWDKRGPRRGQGEVVFDPHGNDPDAAIEALVRFSAGA